MSVNTSVEILLDNTKISEYSFIENGMNTLGYDSISEVFFDVYEIKSKNAEFIKEKKGDHDGDPVVELDLLIENKLYKNVRFLIKKDSKVNINPNLLDHINCTVIKKPKPKTKSKNNSSVISESKGLIPLPIKKKSSEKTKVLKEQSLLDGIRNDVIENLKKEIMHNLKEEIKNGFISDILNENINGSVSNLLEDNTFQNKIQKLFQNDQNKFRKDLIEIAEKVSRREVIRYTESGGGTNAKQYANGGIMNGDLTVTNSITTDTVHAEQILDKNNHVYTKKVRMNIIGNDIDSQYTLNHNAGTVDIGLSIYSSNNELVIVYAKHIDANNTIIDFHDVVPATDSYYAILIF
jgi:hypothetical protein